MAFDTEQEIIKAIKQSEDDQGLLFDRMDEDFDYAVGKKYTTEKGYEEYTSTKPQNFMDKVTDGLNRAEMSIMIKLAEDAEEKERRQASTGELFLFGGLNDIDRNLAAQNQPPLPGNGGPRRHRLRLTMASHRREAAAAAGSRATW